MYNRIFLLLPLLMTLALAVGLASCQRFAPEVGAIPKPPTTPTYDYEHDTMTMAEFRQLREGDIILRRGYGMVSDFIVKFLREKYVITHCGILVLHERRWHVISCESNEKQEGVLRDPLGTFVNNSMPSSLAVVRPKGTESQRRDFIRRAHWYLRTGKEFDMNFDLTDTSQFYCAELLAELFVQAYGKDYMPHRKTLVTHDVYHMDNFFDTTYFAPLFNHCNPVER